MKATLGKEKRKVMAKAIIIQGSHVLTGYRIVSIVNTVEIH